MRWHFHVVRDGYYRIIPSTQRYGRAWITCFVKGGPNARTYIPTLLVNGNFQVRGSEMSVSDAKLESLRLAVSFSADVDEECRLERERLLTSGD